MNQDAAFSGVIPSNDGLAVAMAGDAFKDRGSQHYLFHASLESFWNKYRKGGSLFGDLPTNAEYGQALKTALEAAGGFTQKQITLIVYEARKQREAYGLAETADVLRIPGKINQS